MDIQQTDKESLATYVHRFKWEASRCKFNNDTATIRIFLKGLKNADTIATKVYEKGPSNFIRSNKGSWKTPGSKTNNFHTFTHLHHSTLCLAIMTGVFNAKRLVIWHAIVPTYGTMIVIITDMLPWTAQIRYCHLAHQHAAGLTPKIGVGDPPLDITVIPDDHAMITETDLDSATLWSHPRNHSYRSSSHQDPCRSHSRSFHRSSHCSFSCDRSSSSYCHCLATHLTADLHLIGILPERTADLDIDWGKQHYKPAQGSSSTSQTSSWKHKDKRHKQVTTDDPPSEYYSSDDEESDPDDDSN